MTADEQIKQVGEPVEGSGECLVSVEGGPPLLLRVYSSQQVLALTRTAEPPTRKPRRRKPAS